MSVKAALREEIMYRTKELRDIPKGTDEYKVAVDSLNKLIESYDKMTKSDVDTKENRKKTRNETIFKIVDYSLKGATLLVGIWTFVETLKFDGHAIFSSSNGKRIAGEFLPDMKKLMWSKKSMDV